MKFFRSLLFIIVLSSSCFAQQWVNYFAESEFRSQAFEGKYLWVTTKNYLTKLNTQTGEIAEFYYNFRTKDNNLTAFAIDQQGDKWVGTYWGELARFDEHNWSVYNPPNSHTSGFTFSILSITIDQQGNKWIGTTNGLDKFDGQNWTVYDTSNSGLPNNHVISTLIDPQGNK